MLTPSDSTASFVFLAEDPTTNSDLGNSSDETNQRDFTSQHSEELQLEPSHPSNESTYSVGSLGSFAHDWSRRATGNQLRIHGRHFVDAYGRVCNLRGVNLSGSCKTPVNHDHGAFPANHESVTFVGRPFPLDEAHEHFSRLRRWGFTFIRFMVTWEAVEHEGEGIYDIEYLDYIRQLLALLPEYGMTCFINLHQDVWSRYSGGSGAPAWTLEAVGFNLHALEESAAAWLLGVKGGGHIEEERGIWPCGYQKLAAATMATCFWAGDTFAPKLKVKARDGRQVPVQQYLQGAYLDMFEVVASKLGDLDGVLGFQVMNEPHRGYIDASLHTFDYNTDLHLSHVPSAFQSFMLGSGYPTLVPHWTRSFLVPTRLTSHNILNTVGRKAWREDGPTEGKCLWEMHGVWGWDLNKKEGVVLRENYFVKDPITGRKIDWYADFYYPFLKKWGDRVRSVSPADKLVFLEPIPNEFCPASWTRDKQLPNMVYAPHWYDLNALFAKAFGDFTVNVQGLSRGMFPLRTFYWGQRGARENYSLQIRNIVEAGYRSLGEMPIIVGECGVPMDMNKKEAINTDDWTWPMRMMDAMITGLEQSLVGFTLWNYNPDNSDAEGDHWNGENFSWFSRRRGLPPSLLYFEQTATSLDNGARMLRSIVRPYPAKTSGIPIHFQYEMTTGEFAYEWANPDPTETSSGGKPTISSPPRSGHPTLTARETEIFVPSLLTRDRKVVVRGLGVRDSHVYDESRQTLFVLTHDTSPGKVHRITVSLQPPLKPPFDLNDFWGDFGPRIFAGFALIFGLIAFWILMQYV